MRDRAQELAATQVLYILYLLLLCVYVFIFCAFYTYFICDILPYAYYQEEKHKLVEQQQVIIV